MKQILIHKNGRLKTGRLTGLVFLALLATAAVSFELSEQVQDQVVMVQHIFKPEEVKETSPVQQKKSETVAVDKAVAKPPAKKEVAPKQVQNRQDQVPESAQVQAVKTNTTEAMQEFIKLADQPVEPKTKPLQLADSERLNQIIKAGSKPLKQTPKGIKPQKVKDDGKHLAPPEFMALMQSWRNAGTMADGQTAMSIEIMGLKDAYPLLQMKPVAVLGTRFFDLGAGGQIGAASLDQYSATVFAVTNATDKFAGPLQEAGLLNKPGVEVRYYMYDFIRNSIYARANTAYKWCLDQGLIPADTPPADVEITGGAFAISQQGGGQFAVFIPQQLTTAKGQVVAIDPDCYAGQNDVHYLKQQGVI